MILRYKLALILCFLSVNCCVLACGDSDDDVDSMTYEKYERLLEGGQSSKRAKRSRDVGTIDGVDFNAIFDKDDSDSKYRLGIKGRAVVKAAAAVGYDLDTERVVINIFSDKATGVFLRCVLCRQVMSAHKKLFVDHLQTKHKDELGRFNAIGAKK